MKCNCCGKELGEFTLDIGFKMPDVIWELPRLKRLFKARTLPDFASLGSRYFLRGMLYIPINDTDEMFGWGIWAEVDKIDHHKYLNKFSDDNTFEPPFNGWIANQLPGYSNTIGIPVQIQLGSQTQRPNFGIVSPESELGADQDRGINLDRVHDFNKH